MTEKEEIKFLKLTVKALACKEAYIKTLLPISKPSWIDDVLYNAAKKYGDLTKIILLKGETKTTEEDETFYKGTSQ